MAKIVAKKEFGLRSKLLQEYLTFLRDHLCITESTIRLRKNYVTSFLFALKMNRAPSKIHSLKAHTIHDYIVKTAKPFSRAKRKFLVASLRSFIRFAYLRGYLDHDLIEAVPVIRTYKLAALPQGISWESVKKLLAAPDRSTPSGRRDYAILQLLSAYGIRIGQALSLKLSDIKWREGVIHFKASKGGKPLCFPLQKQVALALLTYIRKDRNKSLFPDVFLTVTGERRPLCKTNYLAYSLRRCYKTAEVHSSWGISYPIRHAFATRLVEQGTPIKTISDLLGHRSINTTFIYTKVDIQKLKTLARDWPEVML